MPNLDGLLINPISVRMIPAFIPHGLLYIASYAIKCGYNINIYDRNVDISEELRRVMARQAEAERERRAKVIAAEGEYQAAEKICQAAELMQKSPMALQLRYLQTLVEIGKENNTTTLFPIPIDIFKAFTEKK